MQVPIEIHVSFYISLSSQNFFTHHPVVVTSAQCFGIGTRIPFEQLREDCVSAFTEKFPTCRLQVQSAGSHIKKLANQITISWQFVAHVRLEKIHLLRWRSLRSCCAEILAQWSMRPNFS